MIAVGQVRRAILGLIVAGALTALSGAAPAAAATGWWQVTSNAVPTHLAPEGKGEIIVGALNVGDAEVNAGATAVTIADKLPPGLEALAIEGYSGAEKGGLRDDGPVTCVPPAGPCTFEGVLRPYERLQITLQVEVKPGASAVEENEATVSGGGAPGASVSRPVMVSGAPAPFGVEEYGLSLEDEGGSPATQAGSHPFQLTSAIALNRSADPVKPPALVKDLRFNLPPGLVGNPTPLPQCTDLKFTALVAVPPITSSAICARPKRRWGWRRCLSSKAKK